MNNDSRYLTVRFCFFILMLFHYACSECKSSDHCHLDSVITKHEERDLGLSHERMLSAFDKTYTASGKKRLMDTLKNPTADVAQIQSQQKKLKRFLEDPALLETTKADLARVKVAEKDLLYFIDDQEDQLAATVIDEFRFKNSHLKKFNKHSIALDIRRYGKLFSFVMPLAHHGFGAFLSHVARQGSHMADDMPSLVAVGSQAATHAPHDHGVACCAGHNLVPVPSTSRYATILNAAIKLYQLSNLLHFAMHVVNIKDIVQQMDSEIAVLNQLYKRVCAVKGGLSAMSQLNNCVQERDGVSDASNLASTVSAFASITDDSYFNSKQVLGRFSRIGKTLYTYQLLKEKSAVLKDCMAKTAEIDALVSMAEWYKEQQQHNVPVCFVDFVDSSVTPVIKLKDAWHVGLDPAKAVVSDIELTSDNGANKFIITGPHKGGKTGFLEKAGLIIVSAQTYGIVPASQAEITPFHRLVSYIVVSGDTKRNASSFSSELDRAQECLEILQSLPHGQFACLLVDDSLLKRTDAQISLDKSRKFLVKVGKCANSCALIVVQQRELTKLGEGKSADFKNYRIKMGTDAEGKPQSLFILEEGVVEQGALLDIVEQDHSDSLLDD